MPRVRIEPDSTTSCTQRTSQFLECSRLSKQEVYGPGTPSAAPIETARVQAAALASGTQSTLSTWDRIFVIGSVAVKAPAQAFRMISASWGVKNFWLLAVSLPVAMMGTGCLDVTEIVPAGETTAVVDTPADISPVNSAICNPFGNADHAGAGYNHGVVAKLRFLTDDMPRYGSVLDYVANGVPVDASIYFGKIDVPTRPFDRGFVSNDDQTILNASGTTLYEYFSLRFESQLRLQSTTAPTRYQFALIADDGANLYVDSGDGYQLVVNDDGTHPSKMACATTPVELNFTHGTPIRLDYYQGPRYHISVVALWRAWPENDPTFNPNDPSCGTSGNSLFFNSNNNPPTPQSAYLQMLSRGWSVIPEEVYELPDSVASNPCDALPAMTTQIDSMAPLETVTRSTQIAFTFSSNREDATFQCSLDNSAYSACTSSKTYTGLASADHNFSVRAVDSSGNFDAGGANYAWTVDATAPVSSNEAVSSSINSLTMTWTTAEPATTALNWGVGTDTSETVASDGSYSLNHSVTLTGLSPNTVYSYKIVGSDVAGNVFTSSRRVARTSF